MSSSTAAFLPLAMAQTSEKETSTPTVDYSSICGKVCLVNIYLMNS